MERNGHAPLLDSRWMERNKRWTLLESCRTERNWRWTLLDSVPDGAQLALDDARLVLDEHNARSRMRDSGMILVRNVIATAASIVLDFASTGVGESPTQIQHSACRVRA